MKLAVENYNIRQLLGDIGAIKMIAAAGFNGIDYSFYKLRPGDNLLNKPDLKAFAEEIKKTAAENSVSFVQAHAPFAFKYGDNFDSENYKDIVLSLKTAASFGIPHIVVHSIKCPADVDSDAKNREFYRSFIPYCEEYGIKIAVENLFKHDKVTGTFTGILSNPQWMTSFVTSLGSDCFISCLDVGHTSLTGVEPETFIRGMSPDLLLSLHIQDTDYKGDRHWLPYFGKLNWGEITKALGEIGYRGDLTLEILHYLDRYPAEMLPNALKFAAETGRYLIKQIELNRL